MNDMSIGNQQRLFTEPGNNSKGTSLPSPSGDESKWMQQDDFISLSHDALFAFEMAQTEYEFDHQLTPEEQKQADKINAEIDKILGTEEPKLSNGDQKSADKIYQQIDKIFEDDKVTEKEEQLLSKLENQLDKLYEKYEKPLSEAEEKKLDELFSQLDKLYGFDEEEFDDANPFASYFSDQDEPESGAKHSPLDDKALDKLYSLFDDHQVKIDNLLMRFESSTNGDKLADKFSAELNQLLKQYEQKA